MNKAPPWAYRILVLALSPLLVGYTVWRSFKDGGWIYLTQRLGFNYPKNIPKNTLWVHAASVGEVTTVLPLLESVLASQDPTVKVDSILLTTNTPTAKKVLEQRSVNGVTHAYLPIDMAMCCKRFIAAITPLKGWIVETEIWPWLYASCKRQDISLSIINARLSEKTLRHAHGKLSASYKNALAGVTVHARSPEDRDRYLSIGADPLLVDYIGNLKYMDNRPQQTLTPLLDCNYVLAASTHDDEELKLAKSWLAEKDSPLLVIVPRHPERASAILHSLQQETDQRIAQRSLDELPQTEDRLYLADTLGELQAWYSHASATFVGGSLIKRGGHNILEPARLGIPVIVGPHTENFADVMQAMLSNNAISIANDEVELTTMLKSAAAEDPLYIERADNAKILAESLSGVGANYLQALTEKPLSN